MLKELKLPMQLIGVIVFVLIFGSYFSSEAVQFFFTISHIFKEFLRLLLPFIVFSFIASGILSIKRGAPLILLILLCTVLVSNFIVTSLSYLFVRCSLPMMNACSEVAKAIDIDHFVGSSTGFTLPRLVSPGLMLILGIIVGIIFSMKPVPVAHRVINKMKLIVEKILLRFFIPLLPIYVFGYLLDIQHSGLLGLLIQYYGSTLALILFMHALFIVTFFILAKSSFWGGWHALKNALPSYITAVSTISSTASIPVTVDCAEKNTKNRPLAEMAIPLLANIHLMGAGINIPVLSLATMFLFRSSLPDPLSYLTFAGCFCLSMFAVTGVPGAGLIVMMPLLEGHFDFSPIMLSVLTTLYLLMDATSTGANVMGDGALIIIVNRILKRLKLA